MNQNQEKTQFAVKVWGCRGSINTSGKAYEKYGGHTTCFEILSSRIPKNQKLFVDAGSGFAQASCDYLDDQAVNGKYEFVSLFTHYHYDHIIGLTLSPMTFLPKVKMKVFGPKNGKKGPREMFVRTFEEPYFPRDAQNMIGKMDFHPLVGIEVNVIVIHPIGGLRLIDLETFGRIDRQRNGQIRIHEKSYNLDECLVIRIQRANHPGICLTYRFEERDTGKVAVICTDHEDLAEIPRDLLTHFANANLLIMDAQCDGEQYKKRTAGYGHGTPEGAVRQAIASNVRRMAITHHDNRYGTDTYLENVILPAAQKHAESLAVMPEFSEQYGYARDFEFEITKSGNGIQLCREYEVINV